MFEMSKKNLKTIKLKNRLTDFSKAPIEARKGYAIMQLCSEMKKTFRLTFALNMLLLKHSIIERVPNHDFIETLVLLRRN